MSVNELEWQIYHLASTRIDVESPERQDDQRVQMEETRGGGEVPGLRKALYGLLR